MNLCDAGHQKHDHITVPTDLGPMVVYHWSKYMGYAGYCTGQDDVSMTLAQTGTWDKPIKDLIERLLYGVYDKGTFVDVGAHVGYFSKLAQKYLCKVISYEAESESLELLSKNVATAERHEIWFDEKTRPEHFDPSFHVNIMKIDIEGSEQFAAIYFSELLLSKRVDNIIMEVSPVFNDSYPQLLKDLQQTGYKVCNLDGSPFVWNFDFDQTNLWLHL